MSTLVLVFHPNLSTSSTANRALVEAAQQAGAIVRDEYALYPDGKIDIHAEQEALAAADRVILQFPMYWYSSPALCKQWQDDVLSFGWAYGSQFALEGKTLGIAVTAGALEEQYQLDGGYATTMERILTPFATMARYVKMTWDTPFVMYNAMGADQQALQAAAQQYAAYLQQA